MATASDQVIHETPAAAGMTPIKGLIVLAGVVVAVAALIGIATALQLSALYAGFLFALYWTGLCHADMDQFVSSVVGSLGGLALAYALSALPLELGSGLGMALALGLVLLAIYALIMGWVPVLVNYAFMLFLTVGSIPELHGEATLGAMALAVAVAAIYLWLLVTFGKKLASRQANAG